MNDQKVHIRRQHLLGADGENQPVYDASVRHLDEHLFHPLVSDHRVGAGEDRHRVRTRTKPDQIKRKVNSKYPITKFNRG